MNVHKKSDKWPNKHEQIDFEHVEEELFYNHISVIILFYGNESIFFEFGLA